jgi:hypothetical protein
MPGLRSKAFTLNPAKREATNFYVWNSEDAGKAFLTEELLERLTALYGVRPAVEFVQIATLVENVSSMTARVRETRKERSGSNRYDSPRPRSTAS